MYSDGVVLRFLGHVVIHHTLHRADPLRRSGRLARARRCEHAPRREPGRALDRAPLHGLSARVHHLERALHGRAQAPWVRRAGGSGRGCGGGEGGEGGFLEWAVHDVPRVADLGRHRSCERVRDRYTRYGRGLRRWGLLTMGVEVLVHGVGTARGLIRGACFMR